MSIKITNRGLGKQIQAWQNVIAQHRETQASAASRAEAGASALASERKRVPTESREGRPSGVMADQIFFRVEGDTVRLDYARLNATTRTKDGGNYWMIQEIGTGESATMTEYLPGGGVARIPIRVRSQVDRKISPGLVFMQSGRGVPPHSEGGSDPLVPFSQTDAPMPGERIAGSGSFFSHVNPSGGIRIKREIQGKHFIRYGAGEAANWYKDQVVERVRRVPRVNLRRGNAR